MAVELEVHVTPRYMTREGDVINMMLMGVICAWMVWIVFVYLAYT